MKTVLLCFVMLTGCASFQGVAMDDNERKACAVESCSVWTMRELQELAKRFFSQGYQAGKKSL